jgi:hypothetical protein
MFTQTLYFQIVTPCGFECAQLFVTDHDFIDIFPMQYKSDAPYQLHLFSKMHGIPCTLITDNALEETKGDWNKIAKQYLLSQPTTEPNSG